MGRVTDTLISILEVAWSLRWWLVVIALAVAIGLYLEADKRARAAELENDGLAEDLAIVTAERDRLRDLTRTELDVRRTARLVEGPVKQP